MVRRKRGQALAEYALIVSGVTLVGFVAVVAFGHNVADLIATTAAILPGSEPQYDKPAYVGEFIELDVTADRLTLDVSAIADNINREAWRLDDNVSGSFYTNAWSDLVFERNDPPGN